MKRILLTLFVSLLIPSSVGAAKVEEIENYGQDGEGTYYGVLCDNDVTGSIVEYKKPRRLCITLPETNAGCWETWTLEGAADYACRLTTKSSDD